jgi:hypothetical protein
LEGGTIFSTRMRLKVGIKRFAISEWVQRIRVRFCKWIRVRFCKWIRVLILWVETVVLDESGRF